jgi:hypothetical protein
MRSMFPPRDSRGPHQVLLLPERGESRKSTLVLAARPCVRVMPSTLRFRHHRTLIRWSMLKGSTRSAGGSAASITSAWIAWHTRNEVTPFCERLCPAMTERTKEKESEAERRQTQWSILPGPSGPGPRRRYGRRTSIGAPPRFSPRGRVVVLGSASGHASWDVACPSSGRYPSPPVPKSSDAPRAPVLVPRD